MQIGTRLTAAQAQETLVMHDRQLASISHDLRNPLTVVKAMAHLLRRRAERTDTESIVGRLEGLASIEAAVARADAMLDELLDAARLQAGSLIELARCPTDIVALSQKAVREHQQLAPCHCIRFATDLPVLVGDWDATRLSRVLHNLLGNAVKYSPNGGDIWVTLERSDAEGAMCVFLRVEDGGIGIPPADLNRIFARFHRAENVGQIPGTGLGLANVRQIVEAHGGGITVTSAEGQGTTVTVRLPFRDPVRHHIGHCADLVGVER